MNLDIEPCPLIDYLEQNPGGLDVDVLKEFQEAAKGGGMDEIYSFGLSLHLLMTAQVITLGELDAIPKEIQKKTLEQAFNIFAYTAVEKYDQGLVMTAWCTLKGLGTPPDPQAARVWLEAAEKVAPSDDPMIAKIRRILGNNTIPTADPKAVFN